MKGAEQDQELADEAVGARQADRRQRHDEEERGEHRRNAPQAAVLGDHARVAALVDEADEQKQRTGRQAVIDHLQHAAADAGVVEGVHTEHDEAEV